jgi:hypothetical protein
LAAIFGDISCSTPDVRNPSNIPGEHQGKLTDTKESFTSLPKDRFPHSTPFQYFQQLDSLSPFVEFAKDQLCRPADTSCSARLDGLSKASSLDISYDTTQHALKVTALWPYQRQPLHATTSHSQHRTEVGILSTDKPETLEAHEIGMSGLLTVLGQDANPSPTMFSFASRHRDAESSFSAEFLPPTGLHPTLQLRLASHTSPSPLSEDDNCLPYAYLTLPRAIFADKYQLSDPLFLASKNLTALRHITQPVDLEAPEYVMPQWGSSVLLQLSPPSPPPPTGEKEEKPEQEWTAAIPLHLRYLPPAAGGYADVAVPYPAVFWACEPEPEQAAAFPSSPFEKGAVGYDGLFEEGTVFWHVEPKPLEGGGSLVNVVRVPVLDLDRADWVNAGTAAAVVVGFAWVVWKLVGAYARGDRGAGEKEREKKRQ